MANDGDSADSIQTHVIVISVTCNACALLFLVARFLIGRTINRLARKQKSMEKWQEFNDRYPWVLPKFITEQLVTWLLITTSACALVVCSVMTSPFLALLEHPILFIIFSINIGRYIFKLVQDICLLEKTPFFWICVIHHGVALCCYGSAVLTRELVLVGILGLFMESDVIWYEISHIMRRAQIPAFNSTLLAVKAINVCVTFVARFALPIILLAIGVSKENPMEMSASSLAVFFMSLVYISCVNVYLLRKSARSLRKTVMARKTQQAYQFMANSLGSCIIEPTLDPKSKNKRASNNSNNYTTAKTTTTDIRNTTTTTTTTTRSSCPPASVNQPTTGPRVGPDSIVIKNQLPKYEPRLPPYSNTNVCNNNLDAVSTKGTSNKPSVDFALVSTLMTQDKL